MGLDFEHLLSFSLHRQGKSRSAVCVESLCVCVSGDSLVLDY